VHQAHQQHPQVGLCDRVGHGDLELVHRVLPFAGWWVRPSYVERCPRPDVGGRQFGARRTALTKA
jgi:hypothetical protein